jgi:CheY-like chemotaxis protein
MSNPPLPYRGDIVIADDDPDDRGLALEALLGGGWTRGVRQVADGDELLSLLRGQRGSQARPALVLLDLNMPRMDGFETLEAIRTDDGLRDLPVVVFSTSRAEQDVLRSYRLGCNAFHSKPDSFAALESLMSELLRYWFESSELPHGDGPN